MNGKLSRKDKVATTIAKIIESASRLLIEQNARHIELAEIAAAASVSRTTLYRHFPTRDALFDAIYADGLERTRNRLQAIVACKEEPADRIALFATFVEEWFAEQKLLVLYRNDDTVIESITERVIPGSIDVVLDFLAPAFDAADRVNGYAMDRATAVHMLIRLSTSLFLFPRRDAGPRPATQIEVFLRSLLRSPPAFG